MNNFPSMMFFVSELQQDRKMFDFQDVNDILNDMAEQGIVEHMVEPIDDPSVQTDFYDWADVVGILDEIEPGVSWS